jgi:hypothetical protein
MKKIIYMILVVGCFMFTACNDWLNVQPRTRFKKDEMFKTQDGFKNLLTGVYLKLKKPGLYGENLTMKSIEHLAQHWEAAPRSTEAALNDYDYNNATVKVVISEIYAKLYNVIANVNSILGNIDGKKDIFSKNKGMYELIKGEALAIRAYCHFDILRLFGPMPSGTTSKINNLVYVKTVTKDPYKLSSYKEFTQFILEDLNQAEKYLKEFDPVFKFVPNDDLYWKKRVIRMNYYAVLGTKARFYLWTQKKDSAYKYAKKIIDSKKFTLGTELDFGRKDYTLTKEHIFGLNVFDFHKTNDDDRKLYKSNLSIIKRDVFDSKPDIRYRALWKKEILNFFGKQQVLKFKKYRQGKKDKTELSTIPLMRLYEMYLIAIESAPTLAESNALFTKICTARGITAFNLTSENLQQEIIKEYRKEFYGEGLMFYTYKRLGIEDILWSTKKMGAKQYEIPLPDTEIISNK